jgi:hypothetical protein
MDSRLNTLGALILGLVTVSLAWLWARQERQTMEMLQELLHECEERNDAMNETMVRMYEQYHKAINTVTTTETMNYQYIQQHQQDRKTIASLERRLAAAAGRKPGRSDDDISETH